MGASTVMFYIFAVIIPIAAAIVLVYLLVIFSRMREETVKRAYKKAEKLIKAEKFDEAETVLYKAFRAVGWDYAGLLQLKKINKLSTIKMTESGLTKVARMVRVLPKHNFNWVAEPLFLLEKVYTGQDKPNKRARLLADLRNFIDDYGFTLSRIVRADLLMRIHQEEAQMEFDDRNYRAAIRLEATSYLHKIEKLHAQGAQEELQAEVPYQGSDILLTSLGALERSEDREELLKIIQRGIVDGGARLELRRVHRDLDDFFTGRRTTSDAQGEIARMMLKKVLEKADTDKDETGGGESGEGGEGVIQL